jgi:hypothetical protein
MFKLQRLLLRVWLVLLCDIHATGINIQNYRACQASKTLALSAAHLQLYLRLYLGLYLQRAALSAALRIAAADSCCR